MSTILDVARLAGVSTATVSRVINTPDAVKSATRERVVRAMKECNYRYNALARGFATRRSRILGLIVPSITNPIFAESTRGAQDFAERNDYRIVQANTDYSPEREEKMIQAFREMRVDGILLTTTDPDHGFLLELVAEGFPLVLIYSTVRRGPISCVGVDNFFGGYLATRHLIDHGHRRIAMIAGDFHTSDKSRHRWHGYRKCLADGAIPYDPDRVRQSPYRLENGRRAIRELMNGPEPPEAVFCSNDYLAIGAMKGARELGLEIPRDLSVVGFDDMPLSGFFTPGLDTIRQPAYDMGRIGAEVLLRRIETPGSDPVRKLLPLQLIQRESVSRPRSARSIG
ncbi:MAG: LacI family DNA-binding transcriptional regulator [Desulfococcaceae bacterium]